MGFFRMTLEQEDVLLPLLKLGYFVSVKHLLEEILLELLTINTMKSVSFLRQVMRHLFVLLHACVEFEPRIK